MDLFGYVAQALERSGIENVTEAGLTGWTAGNGGRLPPWYPPGFTGREGLDLTAPSSVFAGPRASERPGSYLSPPKPLSSSKTCVTGAAVVVCAPRVLWAEQRRTHLLSWHLSWR